MESVLGDGAAGSLDLGLGGSGSLNTLDGVDSIVKESLNMLCMAEGLPANEKRMHLNQLLMKYEAFLKKLYYLINHCAIAEEYQAGR